MMMSASPSATVLSGAPPLLDAGVDSRLNFLRKTYALFTLGVGVAAGGALAGMTVLRPMLYGPGILALLVGFLIAQVALWFVSRVPVVNVLTFFAVAALDGMLLAPLLERTLLTQGIVAGTTNIMVAFGGTSVAFLGLTAYVFITRKDFSFLGGFLAFAFLGMLGVVLISLFTGLSPGMWIAYNAVGLLLAGAYVLYTTSNMLHHYSEQDWVLAAVALLVDFVLMFTYLLRLLNELQNRR